MEYCLICGARISDNNTTGIGYECRAAMMAAKKIKAKKEGLALRLHVFESSECKKKFIELYENVKFRSSFRANFFASISETDRISKKQMEIMKDMIVAKGYDAFLLSVKKKLRKYEELIINSTEVSIDEINNARKFIKEKKA